MYAEKRFDLAAPPTHYLDGFIEFLYRGIEKTYVYNDGTDCLHCRYRKSLGQKYTMPGYGDSGRPPSRNEPPTVIERIAAEAAPVNTKEISMFGEHRRVGAYREALRIAEYVRANDAWP